MPNDDQYAARLAELMAARVPREVAEKVKRRIREADASLLEMIVARCEAKR